MKEEAGAGWGLIQGKRVAGEPLENRRQNRWKTAGRPLAKLPEDRREAGVERLENSAVKPLESRWKTAVEPAEKTARKPPGKAPFLGDFCQSQ